MPLPSAIAVGSGVGSGVTGGVGSGVGSGVTGGVGSGVGSGVTGGVGSGVTKFATLVRVTAVRLPPAIVKSFCENDSVPHSMDPTDVGVTSVR